MQVEQWKRQKIQSLKQNNSILKGLLKYCPRVQYVFFSSSKKYVAM